MKDMDAEDERRKEEVRHSWDISFLRFGTLGFMVMVPALIGAILGALLDAAAPGPFSWTLALIVLGATGGVFLSWSWMAKEIKHSNEIK